MYIGQASSTSSGIEVTATGETTIDFSSPATNYRGRVQYDNATNSFNLFANASATATLILTSTTVTISGSLTVANIYTKTEVDNLLIPKASATYVDDQLVLKANQSTTYSKTETNNLLATKTTNKNISNQSNS